MIKKISESLEKNPVLRTALIAAPPVLSGLWAWGKRAGSIDMRFNSEMADYDAVVRFVATNMIVEKFTRSYTYSTEAHWDHADQTEKVNHHGLTAGYGTHLGRYRGRYVIIDRSLDTDRKGRGKEYLNLTFVGRERSIVRQFAEDIRLEVGKTRDVTSYVQVFINNNSYWERMSRLPVRRVSSVITRHHDGEAIIDAIRAFEARRESNHAKGLPHHLGIMIHGAPGCGKSSLIHAVASELGRSIYYLNLGSIEKDSELTSLLSGTRNWNEVLLVIEDIDAAGVKVNRTEGSSESGSAAPKKRRWGRKKEEITENKSSTDSGESDSPISLSALLNVLDGILCPDGLVAIATTNHREKLDPALLRAGRFDHTIELAKLGYTDFIRMAELLGQDPVAFPVSPNLSMTGSDMRAMLLGAR
jgi:mitochondrial chaperone BCS1